MTFLLYVLFYVLFLFTAYDISVLCIDTEGVEVILEPSLQVITLELT